MCSKQDFISVILLIKKLSPLIIVAPILKVHEDTDRNVFRAFHLEDVVVIWNDCGYTVLQNPKTVHYPYLANHAIANQNPAAAGAKRPYIVKLSKSLMAWLCQLFGDLTKCVLDHHWLGIVITFCSFNLPGSSLKLIQLSCIWEQCV